MITTVATNQREAMTILAINAATNFFILPSLLRLCWGMLPVSPSADAERVNIYLLEREGHK
jgi:hypothetical protein